MPPSVFPHQARQPFRPRRPPTADPAATETVSPRHGSSHNRCTKAFSWSSRKGLIPKDIIGIFATTAVATFFQLRWKHLETTAGHSRARLHCWKSLSSSGYVHADVAEDTWCRSLCTATSLVERPPVQLGRQPLLAEPKRRNEAPRTSPAKSTDQKLLRMAWVLEQVRTSQTCKGPPPLATPTKKNKGNISSLQPMKTWCHSPSVFVQPWVRQQMIISGHCMKPVPASTTPLQRVRRGARSLP